MEMGDYGDYSTPCGHEMKTNELDSDRLEDEQRDKIPSSHGKFPDDERRAQFRQGRFPGHRHKAGSGNIDSLERDHKSNLDGRIHPSRG